MDHELAKLIRAIDPVVLGERIKVARTATGLTQTELGDGRASTAYISRIESGQRRPDLRLLGHLAERLDVTSEQLLLGITKDTRAELRLALDYAELALASGDPAEALAGAERVREELRGVTLPQMQSAVAHLRAHALEAVGSTDDAILAFEDLVDAEQVGLPWARAAIALSRCYRHAGDFSRAVDVGERSAEALRAHGMEATSEALQLALTIAAAYFERGDTHHAVRLCRKALSIAEESADPVALASAYWNASVMESRQGNTTSALPLAQKALALFEIGEDARNLARLRTQLGIMQLRLDPPEVTQAQEALLQAARELEWTSSSPIDKANNDLALAQAKLHLGDRQEARELATAAHDAVRELAPLSAAEALLVLGQILHEDADPDGAREVYQEAIRVLTASGADRRAGELWFELAVLLEELGEDDDARAAYRSSAATAGLAVRAARRAVR